MENISKMTDEKTKKNTIRSKSLFKKIRNSFGVSLMLLLFAVGVFYITHPMNFSPALAVVTVDINPSIKLLINKEGTVQMFSAYNDEGASIVNDGIRGMTLIRALDLLVNNATLKGYLTQNTAQDIMITSTLVKGNANRMDALANKVETDIVQFMAKNNQKAEFIYIKGNVETLENAESVGMSLGKYVMWQNLREKFTKENVLSKSMEELVAMDQELNGSNSIIAMAKSSGTNGQVVIDLKGATNLIPQEDDTTQGTITVELNQSIPTFTAIAVSESEVTNKGNETIEKKPETPVSLVVVESKQTTTEQVVKPTTTVTTASTPQTVTSNIVEEKVTYEEEKEEEHKQEDKHDDNERDETEEGDND